MQKVRWQIDKHMVYLFASEEAASDTINFYVDMFGYSCTAVDVEGRGWLVRTIDGEYYDYHGRLPAGTEAFLKVKGNMCTIEGAEVY